MPSDLVSKNNSLKLGNFTTAHVEQMLETFKKNLEKYCGIKSINPLSKSSQHKFYSIYLTSGNDESNKNLIHGIANSFTSIVKKIPHIILCQIDNPNLLQYVNFLKKNGNIEVDIIPPNIYGSTVGKTIEKYIKSKTDPNIQTCMIIVGYVNSSTGSINNIKKISDVARKYSIPLHVDCNWAFGYIPINPHELGINSFVMDFQYLSGIRNVGLLVVGKDLLDGYQLDRSIQDLNYLPSVNTKIDPIALQLATESIKTRYINRKTKNKKLATLHQLCLKKLKSKYDIVSLADYISKNDISVGTKNDTSVRTKKKSMKLPLIYMGAYNIDQYASQIPHIMQFVIPKDTNILIEYNSIKTDSLSPDEITLNTNLFGSLLIKKNLSSNIFNNTISISFSDDTTSNDILNFVDYMSKIYN